MPNLKQAESLSEEDEEIEAMAGKGCRRSQSTLLNTIKYMSGVYFALRGGAEHRQLRHKLCQIQPGQPRKMFCMPVQTLQLSLSN